MADDLEDTVDRAIPHFHMREVKNNYRSKSEGRPVYENREYVEIIVPGNATERPCMPVRQEHRERWPEAYRKFQANIEQRAEGTPLEEWSHLRGDPARIKGLKDADITTVDQLADLPDSFASSVGPDFQSLKKKAQQFLNTAEDASEEIRSLRERIESLESENEELKKNQKKKPGRPKKQAETA